MKVNQKKLILSIYLIALVLLVGCQQEPISTVCNPPYMFHAESCCLDVDDNKVCDEATQEETIVKITKEQSPKVDTKEALSQISTLANTYSEYILTDDYHSLYYLQSKNQKETIPEDHFVFVLEHTNLPGVTSIEIREIDITEESATVILTGNGGIFETKNHTENALYTPEEGWRFESFKKILSADTNTFCETHAIKVNECFFDAGILTLDINLCNKAQDLKGRCYYQIAKRSNDAQWCSRSGTYYAQCVRELGGEFTLQEELNLCGTEWSCITRLAIREDSIEVCNSIEEIDVKFRCYGKIAYSRDDPTVCDALGVSRESYLCYIPFIAELNTASFNDLGICSRFDGRYQTQCMTDVRTLRFKEDSDILGVGSDKAKITYDYKTGLRERTLAKTKMPRLTY